MEREETLQNLYEARDIIVEAESITQNYNNLKSQLLSEKSYTKIEDRKITKIFDKTNKILTAPIKLFLYFLGIAMFIIPFVTYDYDYRMIPINFISGLLIIALTYFVPRLRKKILKKEYEYKDKKAINQVIKENEYIAQRNAPINEMIAQVNQDMQNIRQIADEHLYWYPRNYCYSEAVNYFIEVIANFRADTLKEAVNLYVEELRHRQILDTQQQLVHQQKISNVLSTANLFVNLSTLNAVNQNTTAINNQTSSLRSAISNQTSSINNQTEKISNAIGNASNRIIDKLRK